MLSRKTLVSETITTALTTVIRGEVSGLHGMRSLSIEANFVYVSGGTTAQAWVQTSLDGGANWIDIANFAFATTSLRKVHNLNHSIAVLSYTPLDGTLTDNTVKDGIFGDMLRVKLTTVGTYAGGTTLDINAILQS